MKCLSLAKCCLRIQTQVVDGKKQVWFRDFHKIVNQPTAIITPTCSECENIAKSWTMLTKRFMDRMYIEYYLIRWKIVHMAKTIAIIMALLNIATYTGLLYIPLTSLRPTVYFVSKATLILTKSLIYVDISWYLMKLSRSLTDIYTNTNIISKAFIHINLLEGKHWHIYTHTHMHTHTH